MFGASSSAWLPCRASGASSAARPPGVQLSSADVSTLEGGGFHDEALEMLPQEVSAFREQLDGADDEETTAAFEDAA